MRGEVIDFNDPRPPRDRAVECRRFVYKGLVVVGALVVPLAMGLFVALPELIKEAYCSRQGRAVRKALNKWRVDSEALALRTLDQVIPPPK